MRLAWRLNCASLDSKSNSNSHCRLFYKDVKLDCGYRLDLAVEDSVILEIKAVQELAPIHDAQLLSYLRLSEKRVGLIINFHVRVLKDGLKRVVNEFPDSAFSAPSAVKKELQG